MVKLQEKIKELNAESGLHLQYIEDAGKTYNKLLNRTAGLDSAPSVIACVGREDIDDLDEKVGYYGEKLVLFAQELGLNTCWAGIFSRKKIPVAIDDGERLIISIAIGYGENQGQNHKSKHVDQISHSVGERPEWFENGVEMALLAPTAMNQQKFMIELNEDESVEFTDKGGFLPFMSCKNAYRAFYKRVVAETIKEYYYGYSISDYKRNIDHRSGISVLG